MTTSFGFITALVLVGCSHLSNGCALHSPPQACFLNWTSQLPHEFPLIWNDNQEIIYPKNMGDNTTPSWAIKVNIGSSINIGCTQSKLLNNFLATQTKIDCSENGQLTYGLEAQSTSFDKFGCSTAVKESVERIGICYNGMEKVEIGFNTVSDIQGFPLITICHDTDTDNTIMAHHTIHGSALNTFEVSNDRPGFKKNKWFSGISPDTAYTQNNQLTVFSAMFGDELAAQYVRPSESVYLARGHLAPDGDFVHIYEQDATYYFVNVVPQWQCINNGNWKALEFAIRENAKADRVDYQIWTGSKDVLQLPTVNGEMKDIYLTNNSLNHRPAIPVPKYTWKVVKDPHTRVSVTIFMINNPHLTAVPANDLCADICDQLKWVDWDTKDIRKGVTFCCSTSAVTELLPFLPAEAL